MTVCAPGKPPNKVAPHDGPLPAGAESLLLVEAASQNDLATDRCQP